MGVHATSHSDAREVSCRFHCGAMFKTKDNERGHAMNRCRHRQSPPLCASKFILLLTESPPCGPLHPRQQYTTVRDATAINGLLHQAARDGCRTKPQLPSRSATN
jgi:hypothetical protein